MGSLEAATQVPRLAKAPKSPSSEQTNEGQVQHHGSANNGAPDGDLFSGNSKRVCDPIHSKGKADIDYGSMYRLCTLTLY